jgi:hypothetical protein
MEYGAIDLHKKESQIRIVTEDGDVIDRRIASMLDASSSRRAAIALSLPAGGPQK